MLEKLFGVKAKKIKPESYGLVGDSEKSVYYPTFHLSSDNLPEIKDWEVGKEYTIVMKGKLSSMDINQKKTHVGLEIREVAIPEDDD